MWAGVLIENLLACFSPSLKLPDWRCLHYTFPNLLFCNNKIIVTYIAKKRRKSFNELRRLYFTKYKYENDIRDREVDGIYRHVKNKEQMKKYKCNPEILNIWRNLGPQY